MVRLAGRDPRVMPQRDICDARALLAEIRETAEKAIAATPIQRVIGRLTVTDPKGLRRS